MANDYFYKTEGNLKPRLGCGFDVSSTTNTLRYLVSNSRDSNAEIYAPEIHLYFENSLDPLELKTTNLKKLYEARAVRYDYAQDVDSSVRVGNTVLIISDREQHEFVEVLKTEGFSVIFIPLQADCQVEGSLGDFKVQIYQKDNENEKKITGAQVVWFNAPDQKRKITGVHDPENLGVEETIAQLHIHEGIFSYRNSIKYDWSSCLQKNKRQEVCGRCVDVCKQDAIYKASEGQKIAISIIQCVGCGECVLVCPTGALDYAPIPRNSFHRVTSCYENSIALIFSEKSKLEDVKCTLPSGVLPLAVQNCGFLDEGYLLSLVHTTGRPVLIYALQITNNQQEIIRFVNHIFERIYSQQAIYVCHDARQIQEVATAVSPLKFGFSANIGEDARKRERVSTYLKSMVADGNFGVMAPGIQTPFGDVSIDKEQCTLCLSCVDACTIGALVPDTTDNTLRFTPSLCVQCGYCEITCPETDCLTVVYNQLELEASYFQAKVLAQDEIFNCVECGQGFAPAKSIAKITRLMTPVFAADSLRIKSLSCCPDCKAHIMLEALERDI